MNNKNEDLRKLISSAIMAQIDMAVEILSKSDDKTFEGYMGALFQ